MYGLTPVCIRSCSLSALDRLNDFPHASHVNGLTPVCIFYAIPIDLTV